MPQDFSALPPQLRHEGQPIRFIPPASASSSASQQQHDTTHPSPGVSSKPPASKEASNSISPFTRTSTLPSPDGGPGVALEPDVIGDGAVRMSLQRNGWRTWNWRGHAINWTAACPEDPNLAAAAPTVILVHGFGGSLYHWRRTLPALAQHSNVYALDCLGFGWSTKADTADYSDYTIWADQVAAFVEEVAGGSEQHKVILVGNSLGGFTALQAASRRPELVKGLVLMNACGDIKPPEAINKIGNITPAPSRMALAMAAVTPGPVAATFQRAASAAGNVAINLAARAYFQLSKRPDNVRSSLQRVSIYYMA